MKKKKLNIKNLFLLIGMVACLIFITCDFINVIKNISFGFTWHGLIVDGSLLIISLMISNILFEEE